MRSKPVTIEQFRKIATERGGKCLAGVYTNAATKLLWECHKGHQWEAAPYNVKSGTWCPYCARKKKYTIEQMRQLAKEHGGKCLSDEYKNTHTKMLWECSKGHRWATSLTNIRHYDRWCPSCSETKRVRAKSTIENMQELAAKRDGKCLSSTYQDARTKSSWECRKGHQWDATPGSIAHGSWCPFCAGNARYTIEDMQKAAKARGGQCLSKQYKNNMTKLLWECSVSHRWEAIPMKILKGTWCRKCHFAKQSARRQKGASK